MLHLAVAALALNLPSAPRGERLCRRSVLQTTAAAVASLPFAALADVRGANEGMPKGEKDVMKYLSSQGFSTFKVGNGLSPLVGYIGTASPANIDGSKFKDRAFSSTLLVRFS